jgi:opacity protein-like surface antigen
MQKWKLSQVALVIAMLGALGNAYAVAPGLYMGLVVGPATNGAGDVQAQVEGAATTTLAKPKASQFGTRILVGYKINQYVGSEFGLNYFSTIRYDTQDVDTCSSTNARVQDFDASIKANIPLRSFEVFGRAGVAAAYQTSSGALNPNLNATCGESQNVVKIVPTIAVGVGYDLSQNWVIDLSATRVMVSGKIGTMDLYGLGISYHFVDIYCGQFLC